MFEIWPGSGSIPTFPLLLQDSGDRYTLNSIYKDETQCPAVQYKCRRGGRGRPLVWQRQESNTFKGGDVYMACHNDDMICHDLHNICFVSGCPVRRQSCNTTSSDPEINNVLAKETAYTFSMCSGRFCLSGGMQQHIHWHLLFKYIVHCTLLFRTLPRDVNKW